MGWGRFGFRDSCGFLSKGFWGFRIRQEEGGVWCIRFRVSVWAYSSGFKVLGFRV